MKRMPFVMQCKPGKREAVLMVLFDMQHTLMEFWASLGAKNVSLWRIEDFILCYGEYPDSVSPDQICSFVSDTRLQPILELFSAPGTLPLMYENLGIVREDKSLIRHRVFATRLKEGCEEEYKRRHDVLSTSRGDEIPEGPESNFTIWLANGYIFGYCELVRSFDHEPTEEEKAATIAWEVRQLEIMDWLTDDVDWITGEKHNPVALIFCQ